MDFKHLLYVLSSLFWTCVLSKCPQRKDALESFQEMPFALSDEDVDTYVCAMNMDMEVRASRTYLIKIP